MCHALQIAYDIILIYETSPLRLWHPHLSWSWLGVAPRTFVLEEERSSYRGEDVDILVNLSAQETIQGLAEQSTTATNIRAGSLLRADDKISRSPHVRSVWIPLIIYRLWNSPTVLRMRVCMSRLVRATQHSPHLQHALKNATGVALLSFAAFLPDGSPGSWSGSS